MIVSGFAVIAIVSSALAFTAKNNDIVFCDNGTVNHNCDLAVTSRSFINHGLGSENRKCVAISQASPCSPVTVFKTND